MNPTPDVSGHGTMFRFHQAPPVRAPAEVVNRCTRHQRQLTRCAAQWTERTKARGHRVAETWRPGSVTCWSAKAQGSKTVCTTETSETFQIKDYTFENNWTYLTCLIDEQFFFWLLKRHRNRCFNRIFRSWLGEEKWDCGACDSWPRGMATAIDA